MEDSFRPDVFLQAFKEIQKEKHVNEHSLKLAKEEKKLLEHKLKEVNANFSSVRKTRNKMNEMKEVAECKLGNNQEVIERLTTMKEAKLSTIAELSKNISEEQANQSKQIRAVEDELDLLASHFRHAKTYYSDHSLNTEVDTLTCEADKLQQQAVKEEATVSQLTETVQSLHITNDQSCDAASHLDKEIIVQMLEEERDQINRELQQLFNENDRVMAAHQLLEQQQHTP